MRHEPMRAGGGEFFRATEAPKHADARHGILVRGDDVVRAVADHDAIAGGNAGFGEDMADEITLVVARAVFLGAMDRLEQVDQPEMRNDRPREDIGLRRDDREVMPGLAEMPQAFDHAGIDLRAIHAT